MSKMKEMQITIEEVARIALEDQEMRSRIGHELGLPETQLEKTYDYLNGLMNNEAKKAQDLAKKVFGVRV